MNKLICVDCEKMNGRDYGLLKNYDGVLFCPHCGQRTPRTKGKEVWAAKETE